jgi:hypothetical protein
MSSNGRFVAFVSANPILVPGDSNREYDAFVRDRAADATPTGYPDLTFRAKSWNRSSGSGVSIDGTGLASATFDRIPGRLEPARLRIRNVGAAPADFSFSGADSSFPLGGVAVGLKVRYRVDGVNVTRSVRAGTLMTPVLAPGESFAIAVRVSVTRRALCPGSRVRFRTASALEPSWMDAGYLDIWVSCDATTPAQGWARHLTGDRLVTYSAARDGRRPHLQGSRGPDASPPARPALRA